MNNETKWILKFLFSVMTFKQQIQLLEKAGEWAETYRRNTSCLAALQIVGSYQRDLFVYQPRMLLGRLANGFEMDHGKIIHAVAECGGTALCGAKPGRRSVGWSDPEQAGITCPRCLDRVEKVRFALARSF